MHIPADMSFVILNQNSCFNSLLDQLLFILKNNFNAIPIIPLLPHPDDYRELSLLAPPNSYLLFKDFDNVESLVTYLKRTIENKELFASYHSWKRLYTMNTVGGESTEKSTICKFCQLGHLKPPTNRNLVNQRC
ncbi:hypothetical protein EB796_015629 [Bugula neritina]|uniref:Fucosyltransferase n=1 Tax=Bugula neritina TaxID=10212 RepID=A0A7J7JIB8_BUGNE|nr:hypothetical protein EB796_015629 [Bugula neritina]